ncbi:MAG: carbamoyl-phosphate synthase small subunit [Cycloclasticus sp. symbiont of Bathymodiolus heckerae]|nr:MAG: carbamoyl-phosphate synthase small subunit [Cycloclasticus sp. symbiont of Bathymodiolus heckerae]
MSDIAILVLEDGSVFRGQSIGVQGLTTGEVVFNTSMTGYQEILTDPSYSHQIVTLTYPHIGNTGVNAEDEESADIHARGLVIRDLPLTHSNWRSEESLSDYLIRSNIVAIADIDTRKLTRILREKGAQRGCIIAGIDADEALALESAKEAASLKGLDLAQVVTCDAAYDWTDSVWALDPEEKKEPAKSAFKVVAYDFGVKRNILRLLVESGCEVHVVPAKTPASEVLAMSPDGVFLSNGPGDPEPCDYAIEAIKTILENKIPMFGICLGHQLLALASGASTVKMKFGHHGANHPVQDLKTQRVMITSQNHGFAVDADTLPANLTATHVSLFDKSLQGVERTDCPAFSFQGHPEASPGPQDIVYLFERFTAMMAANKAS